MLTTPLGLEYPEETDTVTSYPAVAQQVAQWIDTRPGIGRLSTAARDALAAPDIWTGKAIYNITTKTFQVYDPTNGNWSDIPSTNSSVITRSMFISPSTGKLIGELVIRPAGLSVAEQAVMIPTDGSFVASATWPLLDAHMSAAGYPYGHNVGAGTFGVPDTRDRVIIGATAAAPGGGRSARPEAQVGGEETHVTSVAELPSHNHGGVSGNQNQNHSHDYNEAYVAANENLAVGPGSYANLTNLRSVASTNQSGSHTHNVTAQGGGAGHNNMQPYIAVPVFIVAA